MRLWISRIAVPFLLANGPMAAAVAQTQPVPAPATPPVVPLTPAHVKALVSFALLVPYEVDISELVAVSLGLSGPGETYSTRQFAFRNGNTRYNVAVHVSGKGPVIFSRFNGTDTAMWVCDKDAKLINAATVTDGLVQIVDVKEARESFDQTMQVWIERIPAAALTGAG